MDAMLSTSEVAELTGISLRHVKRLAASNKLPCEKTVNSNNRPKYLFPLSGLAALDPTLPQRYLAQHAQEGTAEGAAEPQNAKRGRGRPRKGGAGKTAASKPLEEYSTEERGEIAFWTQAVQDWRGYRAGYRDKAAADEAWLAQFRLDHPEVHITRKILYARQRAVLEDDLDGLVDGRGKARRGYCKIPAAAWDAFMRTHAAGSSSTPLALISPRASLYACPSCTNSFPALMRCGWALRSRAITDKITLPP